MVIFTGNIAQELLLTRRRKFGNPVILSSRNGCPKRGEKRQHEALPRSPGYSGDCDFKHKHSHGSHLGDGEDHKPKTNEGPNVRPKQTSNTPILQALCVRTVYAMIRYIYSRKRRDQGKETYMSINSHVACKIRAKLNADSGLKFLYKSPLAYHRRFHTKM